MQKAVGLNPHDEQSQLLLCNFYLLAQDKQSALAQYKEIKSLDSQLAQKLYQVIYNDKLVTVSYK
jgi:DNA-binding SARP family transcriptional activator